MKPVLILLDFINDIVNTESKFAASSKDVYENSVIKRANQAIHFAREHNVPIIFVKVGFSAGYPECPPNSPLFSRAKNSGGFQLGTWGAEFHPDIDKQNNDLIIVKHRVSAFYATSLEAFLRANSIDTLILAGVSTDMAVQTTARDAHDRDYQVVIVEDACGAIDREVHQNAIKMLSRIAKIIAADKLALD